MDVLFEERQYLGYNKFSIIRRIIIAIFCFSVYFFSENDELHNIVGANVGQLQGNTAQIFFFMGIVILVLSVLLIFILHIKTQVYNSSLVIDGIWTARRVKIDLGGIVKVRKIQYSRYLLNRPVYNLHRRGRIKFFTMGNEAIELTDRDGLLYILGSQKAEELLKVLQEQLDVQKSVNK